MRLVGRRLERGEDPIAVLEGCRRAMTVVGDRYHAGDFFLAELLLSAEIFKAAVQLLEPRLAAVRPPEPLGKVVLATMQGDIHDLGKNILATLLHAQGFEVHDLGVDVAPARLVESVEQLRPRFVGFSALVTTSFDNMKEAARLLADAGLRQRLELLVGGGVTTPQVLEYVGADFQTRDAVQGVAHCVSVAKREAAIHDPG